MSYVRHIGSIDEVGTHVQVEGDPQVALIAQLNRFAGKSVAVGKTTRVYLRAPIPLASGITDQVATTATTILYDRFADVPPETFDASKLSWAIGGMANPVPFVGQNLAQVTVMVSQYGDKKGLAPASVGITRRDPRFSSPFPWATALLVGGVVAAAVVAKRRRLF